MKTFRNVETEGVKTATGEPESYASLAIHCLNVPKAQGGFTIAEMGERLKVIEKLKTGGLFLTQPEGTPEEEVFNGKVIELEDAEVVTIQTAVKGMDGKWGKVDKEILDFAQYVASL